MDANVTAGQAALFWFVGLADQFGKDESPPLERPLVAKIHKIADRLAGDAQVVEELRLVLECKLANGLEFHNQTAQYEQVRDVPFLEQEPVRAPPSLGLSLRKLLLLLWSIGFLISPLKPQRMWHELR
jgi:hypothetical protein